MRRSGVAVAAVHPPRFMHSARTPVAARWGEVAPHVPAGVGASFRRRRGALPRVVPLRWKCGHGTSVRSARPSPSSSACPRGAGAAHGHHRHPQHPLRNPHPAARLRRVGPRSGHRGHAPRRGGDCRGPLPQCARHAGGPPQPRGVHAGRRGPAPDHRGGTPPLHRARDRGHRHRNPAGTGKGGLPRGAHGPRRPPDHGPRGHPPPGRRRTGTAHLALPLCRHRVGIPRL